MKFSNRSSWLNGKVVITSAAVAGFIFGSYYCYKRFYSKSTGSLWAKSSLCAFLTRCFSKDPSLASNPQPNVTDDNKLAPILSSNTSNLSFAKEKKIQGNRLYSNGSLEQAINCYSEAIDNLPDKHIERSICFCNRAACYLSLGMDKQVVSDCTEAIEIQPLYLKAFERRSRAYESLGNLEAALCDLTACCVIDGFSTQSFPQRIEKILRSLSQTKAQQIFQDKKPKFPSKFALADFFSGLPKITIKKETESETDAKFQQAKSMIVEEEYNGALKALLEIFSYVESSSDLYDELNFYLSLLFFLKGNFDESLFHYNKISSEKYPLAFIIRASILLERSLIVEAKEEIEKAISITSGFTPSSNHNTILAFLYFHLGECEAILGNAQASMAAYNKAIKFLPTTVHFYIHKSRAAMTTGNLSDAESSVQEALSRFPNDAQVLVSYAEYLILNPTSTMVKSENPVEVAFKILMQALSICQGTGKSKLMPSIYLNLAVLSLYSGNNPSQSEQEKASLRQEAISFLNKAIEIDPLYDAAHIQLAQLLIPDGAYDEAMAHFNAAIDSCRSFQDLAQLISLKLATKAQIDVCKANPALDTKIKTLLTSGGGISL